MSEVYNAQGRINQLSVLCIDAYGVAVKNGFKGTVEEWLASLKGENGSNGQDGADGKTAYEYAKDGGYAGTEEEFAEKMAQEYPAPTLDAVGKAIIVSETGDGFEFGEASGGATSWEDLGSTFEEGFILAECTPEVVDSEIGLPDTILLTVGGEYTVNWNGTPYKCVAQDASAFLSGAVCLGDYGFIENNTPTEGGEPFCIVAVPAELIAMVEAGVVIRALDGSETVTLSITGTVETVTPVPKKYLPKNGIMYYGSDKLIYKTADTSNHENVLLASELKTLVELGIAIYMCFPNDDGSVMYRQPFAIAFNEIETWSGETGYMGFNFTYGGTTTNLTLFAPPTSDVV